MGCARKLSNIFRLCTFLRFRGKGHQTTVTSNVCSSFCLSVCLFLPLFLATIHTMHCLPPPSLSPLLYAVCLLVQRHLAALRPLRIFSSWVANGHTGTLERGHWTRYTNTRYALTIPTRLSNRPILLEARTTAPTLLTQITLDRELRSRAPIRRSGQLLICGRSALHVIFEGRCRKKG